MVLASKGVDGTNGAKGDTGEAGAAATVAVGTVTTLAFGSPATVTNSGTSTDAVLNFGIPKGEDGGGTGDMKGSDNLSDVADPATALANIGGLAKSANLSDVASAAIARSNLKAAGAINEQMFTSSAIYTPSANLLFADIEVRGSGGGGGGCFQDVVPGGAAGGGGGQGRLSRSSLRAATIGASQTITIGAAGTGGAVGANNGTAGADCSFGALVIGKGGGGGGACQTSVTTGVAGVGGVPSTGTFTEGGCPGGIGGLSDTAAFNISSGCGGGPGGGIVTGGNGHNATNYGAGGSGGNQTSSAATHTASGGNDSTGYVLVREYLSQ